MDRKEGYSSLCLLYHARYSYSIDLIERRIQKRFDSETSSGRKKRRKVLYHGSGIFQIMTRTCSQLSSLFHLYNVMHACFNAHHVSPKCNAAMTTSVMVTFPSLFMSAFGFQFGSPGSDPKANAIMTMSVIETLPSLFKSPTM